MAISNAENLMIKDDINMLLLGETGVGKSTFINSFMNYLSFDTFEEACRNNHDMHCLIPTKFTVIDDYLNEKVVEFGQSNNESTAAGESATLKTKSYIFNLPKSSVKLRIIDTPGIGDTRGISQDDINQENIINSLANIKYINVICIFLKPNQARCTVTFQYCINRLLMLLHKSALENIVFIFTNTCHSFFTPGETVHSLQKILTDIEVKQGIQIPFNKDNSFCVDNESFRYLLAQKNNITLGNEKIFSNSWTFSHKEYWRIIKYAIQVTPYDVDNTLYIYKVREKFEKNCCTVADTIDILKNDSNLLKKLYNTNNGNEHEASDIKNLIPEIEGRMIKHEHDKNKFIMQISKLVTFLKANAIIVYNDYSQNYINYLIDQENSMGSTADRCRITEYYNLINYHENTKKVISMDVHYDLVSPVRTTEELLSIFPHLEEDVKYLRNMKYQNEIDVSKTKFEKSSSELNLTEETDFAPFTFDKWFDIIKDGDQVQNCQDYKELRKHYVKQEHLDVNTAYNMNVCSKITKFDSNNRKVPFKRQTKKLNKSLDNRNNRDYSNNTNNQTWRVQEGSRTSSDVNKPSDSCSLDFLNKKSIVETEDFVFVENCNDNFVWIDSKKQTKIREGFHSKSRGRRTGHHGNNQQSCKGNSGNSVSMNQPHNTQKQCHNKPNFGKTNKSHDKKKPSPIPSNVLQSMKTIFD